MQHNHRPSRQSTNNLLLDSALFVAFLIATSPMLTGLAIHEWLSLAFGSAIIIHLLLHWRWISTISRNFFRQASWNARINYLLNVLLFIVITTIVFTGVMISEVALPFLGLRVAHDRLWMQLHRLGSDAAVVLIGLHVALHWHWIVGVMRRLLISLRPRRQLVTQPGSVEATAATEALP